MKQTLKRKKRGVGGVKNLICVMSFLALQSNFSRQVPVPQYSVCQLFPSGHTTPSTLVYSPARCHLSFAHTTAVVFNLKACTSSSGWIIYRRSVHMGKQSREEAGKDWMLVYSLSSYFPSASTAFWDDKLQVIQHILPPFTGMYWEVARETEGTTRYY